MRISSLLASSALVLAATVYAFDEATMLCLVNEERGRYGLEYLGLDDRLNYAAAEHSRYQASREKMTHNGSGGSSPADRVDDSGYYWQSVAENVAYGYYDEEECMQNWMNSPGHRKNILGASYTNFGCGVGYSRSGVPYYTQDFGSDGRRGRYEACPGGRGGYSGRDSGRDSGRTSRYEDEEDDWYSGSGGNDDWYDNEDDWYNGGGDDDWYDGGNDDWYDGGNDDWYDGGGDEWYDGGDDGGDWTWWW